MAKYLLKFIDAVDNSSFIECKQVEDNDGKKFISILSEEDYTNCIWLDKSTAIKFAKKLRTEINKIKD